MKIIAQAGQRPACGDEVIIRVEYANRLSYVSRVEDCGVRVERASARRRLKPARLQEKPQFVASDIRARHPPL